jgi:ribonuclease BN (tRNA processing enzyme)
MHLTVIGCGDAFSSNGRLQSSVLLEASNRHILIDCGATTQVGINRLGIDANAIDTVLISHLHGDHYAGLIWLVLAAQYATGRTVPLHVVGPPGIAARYHATMEILYPGMTGVARNFELAFHEVSAQSPHVDGGLRVDAFEVSHPSGAPSHALRIAMDGRVIGFSGDTEWVEALVTVAAGADLFITECCSVERSIRYHMNWRTLAANLPRLTARRLLLTHMNPDMIAHGPTIASDRILLADDGLRIAV